MGTSLIRRVSLSLLLVLLACDTARSENLLKGRARWEWIVTNSKGKKTKGTFMGYVNGEVRHGKLPEQKLVGHWKAIGEDRVQATLDNGALVGSIDVTLTQAKIPTYVGTIVDKNGKTQKIVIELYKD